MYPLKWEVGRRNGAVKVLAGAELENAQVDENSFPPDWSRTMQNPEICEVRGNLLRDCVV